MFFSPLSIATTSFGEERAKLSAFRTFVRFALVWFFSVSSSSWCLGRAAACDCDTPWTFLLPFLRIISNFERFEIPGRQISIGFSCLTATCRCKDSLSELLVLVRILCIAFVTQ